MYYNKHVLIIIIIIIIIIIGLYVAVPDTYAILPSTDTASYKHKSHTSSILPIQQPCQVQQPIRRHKTRWTL